MMWQPVVTHFCDHKNICQMCDVTTSSHTYMWCLFICQMGDVTTGSHSFLWSQKYLSDVWCDYQLSLIFCDHKCLVKIFVRSVMWLPVVTHICDIILFVRWVMWLPVVTCICDTICQIRDVTTSSHRYLVIS